MDGRPGIPPKSAANSFRPSSKNASPKPPLLRIDMLERSDRSKGQYDKRPRHKTKADKYDLKISSNSRAIGGNDSGKRKSSKRRRKKSGLALNSDFKAPNVVQDRLTLKANSGPGMFQKGKASSPVPRRGLPDLSFTEMNFLSKRQDHCKPQQRDLKHGRSSKCKEKENARSQQISEYFERSPRRQTKNVPSEESTAEMPPIIPIWSPTDKQKLKHRRREPLKHSLRRHSAQRKDRQLPASQKRWASNVKQPELEQHQPLHTAADPSRPAESPSSYYSWSITPSLRRQSPEEGARHATDKAAQPSRPRSVDPNERPQHADNKHPAVASHDQVTSEPLHESSVSQMSLDEYTKSTLLRSKRDLWNRFPAQCTASELYTLADLKHLACLEKLEATQMKISALPDEGGRQNQSLRASLSSIGQTAFARRPR